MSELMALQACLMHTPTPPAFIVKFLCNSGESMLSVITDDIASIGDLMQETKRLADIAGKQDLVRQDRLAK